MLSDCARVVRESSPMNLQRRKLTLVFLGSGLDPNASNRPREEHEEMFMSPYVHRFRVFGKRLEKETFSSSPKLHWEGIT
jgi:hypothetical protein